MATDHLTEHTWKRFLAPQRGRLLGQIEAAEKAAKREAKAAEKARKARALAEYRVSRTYLCAFWEDILDPGLCRTEDAVSSVCGAIGTVIAWVVGVIAMTVVVALLLGLYFGPLLYMLSDFTQFEVMVVFLLIAVVVAAGKGASR